MQQRDAGAAVDAATPDKENTAAAETAAQPAIGSTSVGEVEQELDAALAKANENYDLYLRAKADAENIRRRGQEEVTKAYKFAVESFAESLVPVVDSLEKALEVKDASAEQLREGVELTLRQLRSAFEKNALAEINPVGQKFDPHRHQAISSVPASEQHAANQVVSVLQKGWTISERVLRPALVVIAK
ncbi:MAG: nucleotide exchange factor GrpE [Betaproteobacteria bacterium]